MAGCLTELKNDAVDAIPEEIEVLQQGQFEPPHTKNLKRFRQFIVKWLPTCPSLDFLVPFVTTLSAAAFRPLRLWATITAMLMIGGVQGGEKVVALVDGVFVHRYRDAQETIRVETVRFYADWIKKMPTIFMDSKYLRYLGWALSDVSATVRLTALEQILLVDHTQMRRFMDRFKGRIVEMMNDQSEEVEGKALVLVEKMVLNDIITEVDQLLADVFERESLIRCCVVKSLIGKDLVSEVCEWILKACQASDAARVVGDLALDVGPKSYAIQNCSKLWKSILKIYAFDETTQDLKDMFNTWWVYFMDRLIDETMSAEVATVMLMGLVQIVYSSPQYSPNIREISLRLAGLLDRIPLLDDVAEEGYPQSVLQECIWKAITELCQYSYIGSGDVHATPVWIELRQQESYIECVQLFVDKVFLRAQSYDCMKLAGSLLYSESLTNVNSRVFTQLRPIYQKLEDSLTDYEGPDLYRLACTSRKGDGLVWLDMIADRIGPCQQLNACRNYVAYPGGLMNLAYSYEDAEDLPQHGEIRVLVDLLFKSTVDVVLLAGICADILHSCRLHMVTIQKDCHQKAVSEASNKVFGCDDENIREVEVASLQERMSLKALYENPICQVVFGLDGGESLIAKITTFNLDNVPQSLVNLLSHYVCMLTVDFADNFFYAVLSQQYELGEDLCQVSQIPLMSEVYGRVLQCYDIRLRCVANVKRYGNVELISLLKSAFKVCVEYTLFWIGQGLSKDRRIPSDIVKVIARICAWYGRYNLWTDGVSKFVVQELKSSIIQQGRMQTEDKCVIAQMCEKVVDELLLWQSSTATQYIVPDYMTPVVKLIVQILRPQKVTKYTLNPALVEQELFTIRKVFKQIHSALIVKFVDEPLQYISTDNSFSAPQLQEVVDDFFCDVFAVLNGFIGAVGFGVDLLSQDDAQAISAQLKTLIDMKHHKVIKAALQTSDESWNEAYQKYSRSLNKIAKKGNDNVENNFPSGQVRQPRVVKSSTSSASKRQDDDDEDEENNPFANYFMPSPVVKRSKLF